MKQNWKKMPLKKACNLFTDGDWIETKNQSPSGIRLIQTGNIGSGIFKNRKNKARFINEETFEDLNCTEVLPGDLLVSRLPDPVGRSCIIPDIGSKMITAVDCTIIRPKSNLLHPEYLMYYQMSKSYYSEVYTKVTGTTRSRISRKNLGKINISIAPLPEQKRIVAILDEAFDAIDRAKANIERNIENAEEMFQSKLGSFEFKEVQLGSLVEIKTGKLNAGEAVEGGKHHFFTCARETYRIDRYSYDSEAILLAGNNASGDFNVKHYEGKFDAYQRTYIITAKNDSNLDYRFLYFQLLNSLQILKKSSVGTMTRFLKMSIIKNLEIGFPEIHVQRNYVNNIDFISKAKDALILKYKQKLIELNDLKKSILQQAFSGQLTDRNQDGQDLRMNRMVE